ncbi:hypothetical protein [Sphingobium sp. SA916]|uniref:hypothetical protein n=1 Tax=Sphingobium sp. SA916 TaxID=1851207 RepID=UPI000C9F1722|nr:hypothetical protein [Sphingobium sp. SA916]PNQ02124.1 hypothetical protein A8G00_14110 [Sphingobium sp. SA916]
MRRAFIAAALLAAALSPALAQTEADKPQVIVIDYRGTCGGTLAETRKRENIDRFIYKLVREARKAGRPDPVFVARDPSLRIGTGPVNAGTRINLSDRGVVYDRNFGC